MSLVDANLTTDLVRISPVTLLEEPMHRGSMFENLKISRVTLHHVFKRLPNGERVAPNLGTEVFNPRGDVHRVLRDRLITVLASNTKSMPVDIEKSTADSTFQACREAVDADDALLITASGRIANRLADAQVTQVPTEGFLFVICGTVGAASSRFVALMKAEPQKGFSVDDQDGISFSLLSNLVLTPASKLYKVGIFIEQDPARSNGENADGWIAHLYDDNMTQANRQNASIYFYDAFLGCVLPKDNAFRTKKLYDLTDSFINDLDVSPEDRSDLKAALYTYLKVDKSTNISVDDFADTYFSDDPARMSQYKSYMETMKFPMTSFAKDIQDLSNVLKRRTIKFPSGLRISGAAAAIEDMTIETKTLDSESGMPTEHTVVTIPERISAV